MPKERRPAIQLPMAPRPGSRTAHKVVDHETLESVAVKYRVPVKQLILHNFGTTAPEEINWYLHHYVGCTLPTGDHGHLNWRFSSAARPGLIYIPQRVLQMDPIRIVGGAPAPIDLTLPGPPEFLASEKFVCEFKIPRDGAVDIGYLRVQATISIEGEMKQQGGLLKTSLNKSKVKVAIEKKLSEDTKATFAAKFDEKSLKPIADAVARGSKEDVLRAIFSPFEATIKTTYRWGRISVVPEAGVEVSTTPLIVRVSGEYEDYMVLEGAPFRGKFALKGGFNVGLSAKGWAWVAARVGRPVLQQFLVQGGRALVTVGEWLAAEGVLTAGVVVTGTVLGTLGVTALCAWLVQDASRKGELKGLATWYSSAYTAKMFFESRPSGFISGNVKMRDALVQMGEMDAVRDARAFVVRTNPEAARGTDQQALEAYRAQLLSENRGNVNDAKAKLWQALNAKTEKLLGL